MDKTPKQTATDNKTQNNLSKSDTFFKAKNQGNFFSKSPQPVNLGKMEAAQEYEPNYSQKINGEAFHKVIQEWLVTDKILSPIVWELSSAFIKSRPNFSTKDRVIEGTPYGGDKVIPGIKDLTVERVYAALYPKLNLKKTGKGNNISDWTFTWNNEVASRKKTKDEKIFETGALVGNELFDNFVKGAVKHETKIAQAASRIVVEYVLDRGIVTSVLLAGGAGELILSMTLLFSIIDLVYGFGDTVEKEISPYEEQNQIIVEQVKKFLKQKEDLKEMKKNFYKPLPLKSDRLSPTSSVN